MIYDSWENKGDLSRVIVKAEPALAYPTKFAITYHLVEKGVFDQLEKRCHLS
jgi:hypothetical protein